MASIHRETPVEVDVVRAWATLRRIDAAHELFAPVLTGSKLDGDIRTVTFANGMVVHERIVDVDDARRRVAYSAVDGPGMVYHHASMQIVEDGRGRCRFVWTTDFLPAEIAGTLAPLIEQGSHALKVNLERAGGVRRPVDPAVRRSGL